MKWFVKIKGFQDAKYLGTITEKGKEYYLIQWTKFTCSYYGMQDYYIRKVLKDNCILYRKYGKKEQKIRNWFKKVFRIN